jgi:anhydro-N-acetylmuramic acid kinase
MTPHDLMRNGEPIRALGAISGTSMDGIDVALVETDGRDHVVALAGATYPYPAALRSQLQDFLAAPERAETDPLTELEEAVTDAFSVAIAAFVSEAPAARGRVALVGLHGQTVFHRPERRFTRQLGLGGRMALALGIPVVDGFRLADVASGGQGAPLVPLYHAALARNLAKPVMVLNLGGVGNVTWLDGTSIIAFDTGPASALIDDFVSRHFGLPFDRDGAIARQGIVDNAVLAKLLANPFFAAMPPKSLDRNDFHARAAIVSTLRPVDAVATLAAFTIEATAAALAHVPAAPVRWLVAGGGRLNGFFMEGLAQRLQVPVEPVETLGLEGDLIEAQCFGYLAARSVQGLPLSLPTTTGVPEPMPGGRFWPAP